MTTRRRLIVIMIGLALILVSAACTIPADDPAPSSGSVGSAAKPVSALCGYPDSSRVTAHPGKVSDNPIHTVIPSVADGSSVGTFAISAGRVVVLSFTSAAGNVATVYSLDGTRQTSFPITEAPSQSPIWAMTQLALGPDGSIYTIGTGDNRWSVIKTSDDGKQSWTKNLQSQLPEGAALTGIFAWHDSSGRFAVGIGVNGTSVRLVDQSGRLLDGSLSFEGGRFVPQPGGWLMTLQTFDDDQHTGAYIRTYAPNGKLTAMFGGEQPKDSATTGEFVPGGPTGLVRASDGRLIILDTRRGIEWAAADGTWRGLWGPRGDNSDATFTAVDGSPLVSNSDGYYFLAVGDMGGTRLVRVGSKDVDAGLQTPPEYNAANEGLTALLGYGAGLSTPAPLGYYASGQQPSVEARFDPWWRRLRDTYRLSYTVTTDPRLAQPATAESKIIDIPANGGSIQLKLPPAQPGIYEVSMGLIDRKTRRAVSGTCLRYTVGASGQRLDPGKLAAGANWGGPAPLRGVQLADELGIGSYRYQLDFGQLVADPTAQPSISGLSWDSLPKVSDQDPPWNDLALAVDLAHRRGVIFMLQLGQGSDAEQRAVSAGTWGGWARLIMQQVDQHTSGVTYWLPWNEPNNTGYSNGAAYVQKVLQPFADAANSIDPGIKIVDPNTLNVPQDWWRQYIAAGGPKVADVLAVHPYTSYNQSWEEGGLNRPDGDLGKLKTMLSAAGAGDKELWDTETGWWGDGPANFWAQGDDIARKLMWYRYQGIDRWTYFLSEAGFDNQGTSWSLIQYDGYLKTGALAYMTTTAMLADRGKPTMINTGIPYGYAMRFPGTTGKGDLLAAWTDDLDTSATLSVSSGAGTTVTATTVSGATKQLRIEPGKSVRVQVSGSPVFYTAPAGVELKLQSTPTLGKDLLKGQRVTATSSADGTSPSSITAGTPDNPTPWRSGPTGSDGKPDLAPQLTIHLDQPKMINRIAVASPGIRCCTTGLRDYTVEVRTTDGSWQQVGSVKNQFFDRIRMIDFNPVKATAIRIAIPSSTERGVKVVSANYSGADGGLHPIWWQLASTSDQAVGVSAVSAWGPE